MRWLSIYTSMLRDDMNGTDHDDDNVLMLERK